jgi:hypothetical protein
MESLAIPPICEYLSTGWGFAAFFNPRILRKSAGFFLNHRRCLLFLENAESVFDACSVD